jgi:hypothetical protein
MKRALFMHIPKTAGTSVLLYLRQAYKRHSRLELWSGDGSLKSVQSESLRKASYIWLHNPLRELQHDTQGFFTFTFFRDPMERIGSLFAYLRDPQIIKQHHARPNVAEQYLASMRRLENMSFEDFILSDDPIHVRSITNTYANYVAAYQQVMFETKKDYLEHCIQRMDTGFHLIGLTPHLAEDMDLIRELCFPRCRSAFGERMHNMSKKQDLDLGLSTKATERLQSMLELDFALFEEARRMRPRKREALEASLPSMPRLSNFLAAIGPARFRPRPWAQTP